MSPNLGYSATTGTYAEIRLDGKLIQLPPERRTLAAIRCYLETLAFEQQRILFSLRVDGRPVSLVEPLSSAKTFACLEAETLDLAQMPFQLVRTARRQTVEARARVSSAITLVLINEPGQAREYWWNLAQELKQPLLTLSFMPETACPTACGSASWIQLRRWQLQQLASLVKEVDQACDGECAASLSNALESKVLPWLKGLEEILELWQGTLSLGPLAPNSTS